MDIGAINSQVGGVYTPVAQPQPEVRQQEARVQTENSVNEAVRSGDTASGVSLSQAVQAFNSEDTLGKDPADADKKDGTEERHMREMLDKGISEANKKLSVVSNELQYSYHKKTRTVMVKVIDTNTKEVVRELPPQKDLDAIAKMWELAGIMVDERK